MRNWVSQYERIGTIAGIIVVMIISFYTAIRWPGDINRSIEVAAEQRKQIRTDMDKLQDKVDKCIDMEKFQDKIAPLQKDISYIKQDVTELKQMISNFISNQPLNRTEFRYDDNRAVTQ